MGNVHSRGFSSSESFSESSQSIPSVHLPALYGKAAFISRMFALSASIALLLLSLPFMRTLRHNRKAAPIASVFAFLLAVSRIIFFLLSPDYILQSTLTLFILDASCTALSVLFWISVGALFYSSTKGVTVHSQTPSPQLSINSSSLSPSRAYLACPAPVMTEKTPLTIRKEKSSPFSHNRKLAKAAIVITAIACFLSFSSTAATASFVWSAGLDLFIISIVLGLIWSCLELVFLIQAIRLLRCIDSGDSPSPYAAGGTSIIAASLLLLPRAVTATFDSFMEPYYVMDVWSDLNAIGTCVAVWYCLLGLFECLASAAMLWVISRMTISSNRSVKKAEAAAAAAAAVEEGQKQAECSSTGMQDRVSINGDYEDVLDYGVSDADRAAKKKIEQQNDMRTKEAFLIGRDTEEALSVVVAMASVPRNFSEISQDFDER